MVNNAVIGDIRLKQAEAYYSKSMPKDGASEGDFNQVVNHLAGLLQDVLKESAHSADQQLTFPVGEKDGFGFWGDLATQLHWILTDINKRKSNVLKSDQVKNVISFTEKLTGYDIVNQCVKGSGAFLTNPWSAQEPQQSYSDGTNHSAAIPHGVSVPPALNGVANDSASNVHESQQLTIPNPSRYLQDFSQFDGNTEISKDKVKGRVQDAIELMGEIQRSSDAPEDIRKLLNESQVDSLLDQVHTILTS